MKATKIVKYLFPWLVFSLIVLEAGFYLEAYLETPKVEKLKKKGIFFLGNCFSSTISYDLGKLFSPTPFLSEHFQGAAPKELERNGLEVIDNYKPRLVYSLLGFNYLVEPILQDYLKASSRTRIRFLRYFLNRYGYYFKKSIHHDQDSRSLVVLTENITNKLQSSASNSQFKKVLSSELVRLDPRVQIPLLWKIEEKLGYDKQLRSKFLKDFRSLTIIEIKKYENEINKKPLPTDKQRKGYLNRLVFPYAKLILLISTIDYLQRPGKVSLKRNVFDLIYSLKEKDENIDYDEITEFKEFIYLLKRQGKKIESFEKIDEVLTSQKGKIKLSRAQIIATISLFKEYGEKENDGFKLFSYLWSFGSLHSSLAKFRENTSKENYFQLYEFKESEKKSILETHRKLAIRTNENGGTYIALQFPGVNSNFLKVLEKEQLKVIVLELDQFFSQLDTQNLYRDKLTKGNLNLGHLTKKASRDLSSLIEKWTKNKMEEGRIEAL